MLHKSSKSITYTDRILKLAYDIIIDNHHSDHANYIGAISSKFISIGVNLLHIKIMEGVATIFTLNQYFNIYSNIN